MNRRRLSALFLLICATLSPVASAGTLLTFEGAGADPAILIDNFYNGGAGGSLGITFAGDARGLQVSGMANPSGNTVAYFVSTPSITINHASGFASVSFYYDNFETNEPAGSADVYSGPDGTGFLLGSTSLPYTSDNGSVWLQVSIPFAGTAHSLVLTGPQSLIGFDDVGFDLDPKDTGSPAATPLPASFLSGTTLIAGLTLRRRPRRS